MNVYEKLLITADQQVKKIGVEYYDYPVSSLDRHILVVKSISGHNDPLGFNYAIFNDYKDALNACDNDSTIAGNLLLVYELKNDRIIHIEHPDIGLTDGLKSLVTREQLKLK